MHLSWTRCPKCKETIEFEMKPGGIYKTEIGKPEYFNCENCKQRLRDPNVKEWSELTTLHKCFYIFIYLPFQWFFLTIILLVLVYFISKWIDFDLGKYFLIVPSIISFLFIAIGTGRDIYTSKKRVHNREIDSI